MTTWSQTGAQLESQVRKALHDFEMIPEEGGVALALSGGKDSLTLLHLLSRVRGRGFRPFPLVAIHVSGAFTCGAGVQLSFLEKTCQSLDVPLVVRQTHQSLDTLECYSCSRTRRRLLFDAAKEHGCHTLAFGHHRDDSVQTLLMNLLHKGEFAANLPLVPMHRYGVTIIRPLLLSAETDIRTFAQQMGYARITCQCPVGANSRRKQVELLLQQMEELYPHARDNLARAALRDGSDKATRV
jgi:tRNA 2-thiocytidine biosynthesis protein TtcA